MIGIEEWRARIGTYHGGLSRALARKSGTRQLAWMMILAAIFDSLLCVTGIFLLTEQSITRCKTSIGHLLCSMMTTISTLLNSINSLERSIAALAILLIMSGDVEQNPGPIGTNSIIFLQ